MKATLEKDWKRFNWLMAEIGGVYHEIAWRLGLSDSAFGILYAICNLGEPCLLSDIVRFSCISKQTINSALRKLEQEEILTVEAIDGRRKQVCLTQKGRALAQETALQIIGMEDAIYSGWRQEERALYLELTQRYLTALREKTENLKRRERE